jgi:hypothetical protein
MSDNALDSQGTSLAINTGTVGTPTWTTITEAKDINFRTGSATVNDVTDLASTAREKRMGLPDEGQCTFTLNYIPQDTSHLALLAARASRAKTQFQLTMTDTPATVYTFFGYVLTMPTQASTDGVIESSVVIEITGTVTEV